ncbi:short subunit dehydrogenase-like uncharacterized protein [Nocardia transvalensis]|uniref:Short subunit dehydrogenase-like uncharacterized protein n=1 Tax=Nocardia transvalensis TaxID=37333 RepID=A0A7W9PHH2_9NOCA|nr:saccharopine dehydrogenase NADP-binding domain-containing protein [Nocardia transvalensis]MBB5916237.1 short subunit dehydrogenase-like uncharacterized protein [Nocardia transvalensis]
MPKIVLFGATGYTGRLVAEDLVARGVVPVLAGRNAAALGKLATDIGGAETAVADVADPASVRALLSRGDVLVTTVGPFLRYGGPALAAALEAGAHYFDSTGEGPFIRDVFDRDDEARRAGAGLLTAFGFDYVPGNLAAALALQEAPGAVRADIGYFVASPGISGGTRASVIGMLFERGFALRGGRVVSERLGARIRTFEVGGRSRTGASVPGSEHLALTRTYPGLRDAGVYVGAPAAVAARGLQVTALLSDAVARVEPVKRLAEAGLARVVTGSRGGPGPESRARTRSWAVADVSDAAGRVLSSVTLTGGDPYDFTGAILAWGAQTALDGGLRATGALGPVDAFGLDALVSGAAEAGFSR